MRLKAPTVKLKIDIFTKNIAFYTGKALIEEE